MWNLFKVNSKDTRTASWRRSSVSIVVNFEQISHLFVFIVDFQQINAGWIAGILMLIFTVKYFCKILEQVFSQLRLVVMQDMSLVEYWSSIWWSIIDVAFCKIKEIIAVQMI